MPSHLLVTLATQIGMKAVDEATGGLIKSVIKVQDEQVKRLEALQEDVSRLLAGPSRTARLYLEDAAAEGRSETARRGYLEDARRSLFDAMGLATPGTNEHAADAAKLCLVLGLLDDAPGAIRWAVTAYESADAVAGAAAKSACEALRPGGLRKHYLVAVRAIDSPTFDPQSSFWEAVGLPQASSSRSLAEREAAYEEARRLERGELPESQYLRDCKESRAILRTHAMHAQAEDYRKMAEGIGRQDVPAIHRLIVDLTNPVPVSYESASSMARPEASPVHAGPAFDWTAGAWQVLAVRQAGGVRSVAFSPDGRYLATGGDDYARMWELPDGREVLVVSHEGGVWSVAFCPDGRYLATGGDPGTARVWKLPDGGPVARVQHPARVSSVAFSPDGRYLATGSTDGTAAVWALPDGRPVARLQHPANVSSVAFSPDGRYLATGGNDTTARLWALPDGREVLKVSRGSAVTSVACGPDGRSLATGCSDGTAAVWALPDGRPVAHAGHGAKVSSVAFSPDGRYLATGGDDRTARLWELPGGRQCAPVKHAGKIKSIAFSPDGGYLATGGGVVREMARVWKPRR